MKAQLSTSYAWLSVIGLTAMTAGIALQFGAGWALMVCGGVCFLAGGLGSAREGR